MSAAITAAVVVAGAAAYGAYAKGQAAKKAANARLSAIDKMKELDIPGIQKSAQEADKARFKGALELQKEVDPAAAEARQKGLEGVASSVTGPEDQRASDLLDKAAQGATLSEDQLQPLRAMILANAQEAMAAGASLPPDFQAELVRTGLESSGRAGLTPDKQGAAGTTVRKLLGSAGIQLQEQRRQGAVQSLQAVGSSVGQSGSILTNLAQGFQSLINSRAQRATNAASVGQQLLPAFGLTGGDTANLMVANTNLNNQRELAKGDALAQKALASGAMKAELAGAVASGLTGSIGGGAGGALGAAGGAGGSSTSLLKELMTRTKNIGDNNKWWG